MGDVDDGELWARLRAGDEDALGAVFDAYEARLFRYACRLLTSREDAKDAVTISFFELWRKRTSVRLTDGSPLPWLFVTLANVARNLERSARRHRALVQRTPPDADVPAPTAPDETGVMSALRRLPAGERSVVVLTVLEGYPERETALALGIAVGTVKSRLSRAKAKLRDEMTAMEASWT